MGTGIKVRAFRKAYMFNRFIEPGTEFELHDKEGYEYKDKKNSRRPKKIFVSAESQFSDNWMEKIDDWEGNVIDDDSDELKPVVAPKKTVKKKVNKKVTKVIANEDSPAMPISDSDKSDKDSERVI